MNLYFSVLGKLVFDFFVIREKCIYFHVISEVTTFALFLRDFSVIEVRELHQTGYKTCPFDGLADGGLRTNHLES